MITPSGDVPVLKAPATVGKPQGKPASDRPASPALRRNWRRLRQYADSVIYYRTRASRLHPSDRLWISSLADARTLAECAFALVRSEQARCGKAA